MSWPSGDGKPLTIEELKAKAKCENNTTSNHVADSDSDTEPEVIPEPVKKHTKKTTRKPKKTETNNQEHFVKELDLFNLDESDSNDKCQESITEVIDFTETRLVIANICKELKNITSRVAALKTVVQDLSLTDLPKNTRQLIKEVDKLRDLLNNLGIGVPVVKQQRKKAK
ncbi:MPPV-196 late transcription factor VLTF-4 [Magpiepox virus 2]|nr:MPPV-196 late transcription factor VLTF-4 [Magpiepox virus 2]